MPVTVTDDAPPGLLMMRAETVMGAFAAFSTSSRLLFAPTITPLKLLDPPCVSVNTPEPEFKMPFAIRLIWLAELPHVSVVAPAVSASVFMVRVAAP